MRSIVIAFALAACGPKPSATPAEPVAAPTHHARHAVGTPPRPEPAFPDPLLVVERDTTASYADPSAGSHLVTVVAELAGAHDRLQPMCGYIHFGTVLDYKVLAVESGTLVGTRFFAAAGCVQMSRDHYDTNAGTLDAFRTGDQHRLVLSNDPNDGRGMTYDRSVPSYVIVSADPA